MQLRLCSSGPCSSPSKSKACLAARLRRESFGLRWKGRGSKLTSRAQKDEHEESDSGQNESEWKLPPAGIDTNWRTYRARLVAGENQQRNEQQASVSGRDEETGWAHAISQPEKGCLVLAHPLMFKRHQQYFDQAVILLVAHNESMTTGLILNKPMQISLGSITGTDMLQPEFADNTLFLGGDVGGQDGSNVLQLLHNQKQLGKSTEVVDGVYLGGHEAARMAVRKEGMDPQSTCRWYCRYAGWAPGQLQSEIHRGVWFTASASSDMIFHSSCYSDGTKQWHAVMQKMGGDYKDLSDALQVDPTVDYLKDMASAEQKDEEEPKAESEQKSSDTNDDNKSQS